MPTTTSMLASRLILLRTRLDEIWESAKGESADSKERRKQLLVQYRALDRQTMRLISMNVKASGQEYDAATEALGKANKALNTALDGEKAFIDAINLVAEALDLVAKVLPAG